MLDGKSAQYECKNMYDKYSMCVMQCMSLSNDCTAVNKCRQALALMKGCCHLFCRSETIRAPCGSSDRLFFCITLNKRVQCINLTLLGETKEDPLIQYYNSGRRETWDALASSTCYNIISAAQPCCWHRKFMWPESRVKLYGHLALVSLFG